MPQRNKTTILLDDSTRAIAARYGNMNQYLARLMTRNWAQWRRALTEVQRAGMSMREIEAACRALNGSWLVPDSAADMLPDCPASAAHLATLAWEYWHGNDELRGILGTTGRSASIDAVAEDDTPMRKWRRKSTKAQKEKG